MQYIINAQEHKPVKIMFKETDLKSFDSVFGIILWCCIKQWCITDQNFDDDIAWVADYYKIHKPSEDYMTFRDSMHRALWKYASYNNKIDDSFLLMIHQFLVKPETFTFKLDDDVYNLTDDTLKLFKPENFI